MTTNQPAVNLDWADVLAFALRTFPGCCDNFEGWDEARMIRHIQSCWGAGPGFHGDGGNWWSRVVQPAYEKQDRLTKTEAALAYARKVIENYAADIRADARLVDCGFCQGSVYREALADIARIQREGMPK